MERFSRLILFILAGLLFWRCGPSMFGGDHKAQVLPETHELAAPGFVLDPNEKGGGAPKEGTLCVIESPEFRAELSSRGAALTSFRLNNAKYKDAKGEALDLISTPKHEHTRSLRETFRSPGADDQFAFDRFEWAAKEAPAGQCAFAYTDDAVQVTKTFSKGPRPYELEVRTTVKNLASVTKKHALSVSSYAYFTNAQTKSKLGRVAPMATELVCGKTGETTRKQANEFAHGWVDAGPVDGFAALSSTFFAAALVPEEGAHPSCQLLAEEYYTAGQKSDDDEAGHYYHAKLAYPVRELAANQEANYKFTAYYGPKDRELLAQAGGTANGLKSVINYSSFFGMFTLEPLAKALFKGLSYFHGVTSNWGIAIILLTVTLKIALLPAAIPGIKNSIKLRQIKPELDALKVKFPNDTQARQLATMELHRKHGISMVVGCLPQLAAMPIWFAMYTMIQSAVEMYRTPFWWFADLSLPDPWFIMPILLGGFMIAQQKLVPQPTEMDPAQQKMMMWMMPSVFTVMMLFLPAALGVYMLTNSLLTMAQLALTESYAKRAVAAHNASSIRITGA